jgi:WD40 repeat protein
LDTVSGDIYGSARLHKGAVNGIALDAEDRKAVSCGDDGNVLMWNLSEPAAARTVTTQRDSVGVVTFVRGNLVAWGGQDGSVRFANVEQEMDPIGIRVHEGEVTVLAPLLAGEALLSASTDRRAFVWMSRSLTIVEKVSFDRPISCGTIAHDESIVALGDISGGVHFLRFRSSIGADSA